MCAMIIHVVRDGIQQYNSFLERKKNLHKLEQKLQTLRDVRIGSSRVKAFKYLKEHMLPSILSAPLAMEVVQVLAVL